MLLFLTFNMAKETSRAYVHIGRTASAIMFDRNKIDKIVMFFDRNLIIHTSSN